MPRRSSNNFSPVDDALIVGRVNSFMRNIANAEECYVGERYPTLRASSMPYCPLLQAIASTEDYADSNSAFYFRTGTAIHELCQFFGPFVDDYIWGEWKCNACDSNAPRGFYPEQECSCDNHVHWLYEELTVEYKNFSGHVDCVLALDDKCDAFIVLDWKTTRLYTGNAQEVSKFPYDYNTQQVEMYNALLRELFGLNIVGWSLCYVDRSTPLKGAGAANTGATKKWHTTASKGWSPKAHKRVMNRLDWACEAQEVVTDVRNSYEAGRMPSRDLIEELVSYRPCATKSGWDKWMKPKFKYATPNECEWLHLCSKKDDRPITKEMVKTLRALTKSYRE